MHSLVTLEQLPESMLLKINDKGIIVSDTADKKAWSFSSISQWIDNFAHITSYSLGSN